MNKAMFDLDVPCLQKGSIESVAGFCTPCGDETDADMVRWLAVVHLHKDRRGSNIQDRGGVSGENVDIGAVASKPTWPSPSKD
jgi:hypothetical protein